MLEGIKKVLENMVERKASDVHISAGSPLHYRINTQLVAIDDTILTEDDTREVVYSFLSEEKIRRFEEEKELDFSFSIENFGRYRGNAFFQRNKIGCAIRLIPFDIMSLSECGLPEDIMRSFCAAHKGLVLITGATGSGKSTTLASMVDHINSTRNCHIVTVEDPIEFIHKNKKALIDQRQFMDDTDSFSNALRHVLRQDPDVILIGELRDLDTIRQALIIADTGHLVLGTLHTSDTTQTINRMVDVFPAHQQAQIRAQLSFVLLGVLSQQLIPRKDKKGMALAAEVLVATPAIKNMIRDAKEHQIYSILQTSQKTGMRTINHSLVELYVKDLITYDEALSRSSSTDELIKLMQ